MIGWGLIKSNNPDMQTEGIKLLQGELAVDFSPPTFLCLRHSFGPFNLCSIGAADYDTRQIQAEVSDEVIPYFMRTEIDGHSRRTKS